MSSVQRQNLFQCSVCNVYYVTRDSCPIHGPNEKSGKPRPSGKGTNNNSSTSKVVKVQCREVGCEQQFKNISVLRSHLRTVHDFTFHEARFLFINQKEFLAWKEKIELDTNSHFMKTSGEKKNSKCSTQYWQCHHSIKLTTRPNNLCTAGMISKRADNGHISVYICTTHYGHLEDHSPLPKKKRKSTQKTSLELQTETENSVTPILFNESEETIFPSDWPSFEVASAAKPKGKKLQAKKSDTRAELRKQRTSTKTLLLQIGQLVDIADDTDAITKSKALLVEAWKVLAKCKILGQPSSTKKRAAGTATSEENVEEAHIQEIQLEDIHVIHSQPSDMQEEICEVAHIQEIRTQNIEEINEQLRINREDQLQQSSDMQVIEIQDIEDYQNGSDV